VDDVTTASSFTKRDSPHPHLHSSAPLYTGLVTTVLAAVLLHTVCPPRVGTPSSALATSVHDPPPTRTRNASAMPGAWSSTFTSTRFSRVPPSLHTTSRLTCS